MEFRFKQYIPSKPGKFGIKVFWLADVENTFPLRCLVYIGAETLSEPERGSSVSESIVMHVAQPYLGVGRNITMDNWFTSVSLSNQLEVAYTSMVGTIRSNCRDVPPAAKSSRGRQKKDSQYYIKDNKVMCSLWDKANKPVPLLSTKH